MQPDTAFWWLSTISQSSAALAGLTALLLVFVLTQAGRDKERHDRLTIYELLGRFPTQILSFGAIMFLLAVSLSLALVGNVDPGEMAVPLWVHFATLLSMAFFWTGAFALVIFVVKLRGWFRGADRELSGRR